MSKISRLWLDQEESEFLYQTSFFLQKASVLQYLRLLSLFCFPLGLWLPAVYLMLHIIIRETFLNILQADGPV